MATRSGTTTSVHAPVGAIGPTSGRRLGGDPEAADRSRGSPRRGLTRRGHAGGFL